MERTRYFRNANKFNIVSNFVSANVFPLSDEATSSNFFTVVWVILVWLIRAGFVIGGAVGSLYFANHSVEDIFQETGAMAIVIFELMIPTIFLNLRRTELRSLIKKYNDLLIDSDDLKRLVLDTALPYKNGMKFFSVVSLGACGSWQAAPLLKIFEKDRFTYTDFSIPLYLPGAPFTVNIFFPAVIFQIIGCWSINFGKIGVDIYITYLIAVLSAQYKYVGLRVTEALMSHGNDKSDDEILVINALRECVQYHCGVIEIGRMLTKLMALHVGASYLTTILKFCFLAFGYVTLQGISVEKAAFMIYSFACLVHVFLQCSCIQELLDVSTSVTEDAFHENWYARSKNIKKIFCMVEMTNKMECRLSAWRIVDLIVPTLALILSKSYSVFLLLLEAK